MDNTVYRTNSNPSQQHGRRQLPSLPQEHGNTYEASQGDTLSANAYSDRHSLSHQEFTEMNIPTSGRTSPMIILDNSSLVTNNQTRLVKSRYVVNLHQMGNLTGFFLI